MAIADIPVLVKHCALAIYEDHYVFGTKYRQVLGAFAIARHRLVEYGLLKKGSEKGTPDKIKLTAKGMKREAIHLRESDGQLKTMKWDKLYMMIAAVMEFDETETPETEEVDEAAVGSPRDAREVQRKRRHVNALRSAPKPRTRRAKTARARRAKRR